MIIQTIIYSLIFSFCFAKRNAFQFKEYRARAADKHDEANSYNTKWHFWQGGIQLIFVFLIHQLTSSILLGVFSAGIFWIVFDGLINILGLDRDFFYVGSTATIDKFFQRFKKPELILAITKLFFVLLPLIAYITYKNENFLRISTSKK